MRHTAVIACGIAIFCFVGCNQPKIIEHSEGNMTDRYGVDKEGRKHGEFRRFFGGDTLAELSTYDHGKLQGKRTIYNAKGTPEIVETYIDDTLEGPYSVFYDNGDLKIEGVYTDGIMRGIWKRYYPGGQILEEVTYADNVENGPFTEYHENGRLKAKGQYLEGDFEQDTLYLFNEAGVLERKMLCDHGICRTFWLADDVHDE